MTTSLRRTRANIQPRRTDYRGYGKAIGEMQPIPPPPAFSKARTSRTSGVECPTCHDRARALRTGHDESGRVIRQRRCPNDHEFATLEIAVPYTFYSMLEKDAPPRPSATGKRLYRPKRTIDIKVRATMREGRKQRTVELP